MARQVTPSTELTSFSCPHCGTLTTQFWYTLMADGFKRGEHPTFWTAEAAERFIASARKRSEDDPAALTKLQTSMKKSVDGVPFVDNVKEKWLSLAVGNLHISRCYECDQLSIWRHQSLVWPNASEAPDANADLPTGVSLDYHEAAAIVSISPRGAAALLRLAIEKLCKHVLGDDATGDLNSDIGALVGRGLDKRISMALDIVRVIGNEAVHPGTLDLRDNRETADKLFGLVNLIAEAMISQPKHIAAMYETLPETKRKGIEVRNSRALPAPPDDTSE